MRSLTQKSPLRPQQELMTVAIIASVECVNVNVHPAARGSCCLTAG